ncbi:hypothetical protein F5Y18DRAFT_445089 [Xylariaceae sp. FL1019]|nr:hypothetical protein F5Y18DRAFT_445089 [Xylariaceae sp. FL1019]
MGKTVLEFKKKVPEKKVEMETIPSNPLGKIPAKSQDDTKTAAQSSKNNQNMVREVPAVDRSTEHKRENEEGVHRNVEQKAHMLQSTVKLKTIERKAANSDGKQKTSVSARNVEFRAEQREGLKLDLRRAVGKISDTSYKIEDGETPTKDKVTNEILPGGKNIGSGKPGNKSTVRKIQPKSKTEGRKELEHEDVDQALKKLSTKARRKMSEEEEAEIEKVRVRDDTPVDVVDHYLNPRLSLKEKWKKGAWEHRRIWKDW